MSMYLLTGEIAQRGFNYLPVNIFVSAVLTEHILLPSYHSVY